MGQVVQISTIPVNQLEDCKDWLDSSNIVFTEGPVNLNWYGLRLCQPRVALIAP